MKKIYAIIVLLSFVLSIQGQDYRYVKSIFSTVKVTKDVVYGTAAFLNSPYNDESKTSSQNLVMDIYQPEGDLQKNRPAVIFAHGGGFVSGNRTHDDMKAFCDSFAKKGYVAVSIDYRLGVYTLSDANVHYTRAVYRGLQDGRSAVRFLRAKASTYGIDQNKIYFAGSSAGAFIGLHMIYLDIPFEKPSYAGACTYGVPIQNAPDLGDLDVGSNIGFSGEPNGVLALWGAIASTGLITYDNNKPVFLIHGTADVIVPYKFGSPFQVPVFPTVYGSFQINKKLNDESITTQKTYFVNGQGHEFYGVTNGMWNNGTGGNAFWDTIVRESTDFFWKIHKPKATFNYSSSKMDVTFSDKTTGSTAWYWDFGDGNTANTKNPKHTFGATGNYLVKLYVENNSKSWDTISRMVKVDGIIGINNLNIEEVSLYPNPFTNSFLMTFPSNMLIAEVTVTDIYGNTIVKQNNLSKSAIIDLSGNQNGIYFISIKSGNLTIIKKICKL